VSVTNFAFLGRCSTKDQQDPESSRGWQRSRAVALIEPRGGVIVAEYFDVGRVGHCPGSGGRRPARCSGRCATPSEGSMRS
jgi:hypothetical protein